VQKILFVINPVSGGKAVDRKNLESKILFLKPAELSAEIKIWESHDQDEEILSMICEGSYDAIAAVGGDGTVNFLAHATMKKGIPMGIIPMGSGNGLARHLGIPLKTEAALKSFYNGKISVIDTGIINGKLFLCTAGAGFDALIGELFSTSTERGFYTYAKMSFQQFMGYKPRNYKIIIDGKEINRTAFIIAIANVNQYGNNTYIAPEANLKDGLLDVCVVKPFHMYDTPALAFRVFTKTLHKSHVFESWKARKITLYLNDNESVQVDGEPLKPGNRLEIEINPGSLKMIVPA
jgi:diacylglycerol kinase (ATP)